jgi:hypothetical protein
MDRPCCSPSSPGFLRAVRTPSRRAPSIKGGLRISSYGTRQSRSPASLSPVPSPDTPGPKPEMGLISPFERRLRIGSATPLHPTPLRQTETLERSGTLAGDPAPASPPLPLRRTLTIRLGTTVNQSPMRHSDDPFQVSAAGEGKLSMYHLKPPPSSLSPTHGRTVDSSCLDRQQNLSAGWCVTASITLRYTCANQCSDQVVGRGVSFQVCASDLSCRSPDTSAIISTSGVFAAWESGCHNHHQFLLGPPIPGRRKGYWEAAVVSLSLHLFCACLLNEDSRHVTGQARRAATNPHQQSPIQNRVMSNTPRSVSHIMELRECPPDNACRLWDSISPSPRSVSDFWNGTPTPVRIAGHRGSFSPNDDQVSQLQPIP